MSATKVELRCKYKKCGRSFVVLLAEVVQRKGKAPCPHCGKTREYRIDDMKKRQH